MTPAEANTSLAKVRTLAPVEVDGPLANVNALVAAPAEVMGPLVRGLTSQKGFRFLRNQEFQSIFQIGTRAAYCSKCVK